MPAISRHSMVPFWVRKDSTILWAAAIALIWALGPEPKSRYACAPAASAEPQTMPH